MQSEEIKAKKQPDEAESAIKCDLEEGPPFTLTIVDKPAAGA